VVRLVLPGSKSHQPMSVAMQHLSFSRDGKECCGPSLFGVVGRHTGSVTEFHYSVGNQNANLNWDETTLEKYLDSPKTVVPGTTMNFAGIKDADKRADLISYLATLKEALNETAAPRV
jgi:cytochrome c2